MQELIIPSGRVSSKNVFNLRKAGIEFEKAENHDLIFKGENVRKFQEFEAARLIKKQETQTEISKNQAEKLAKRIQAEGRFLVENGGKILETKPSKKDGFVSVLHQWRESKTACRTRQFGGSADGGGEYTEAREYMVTRKKWKDVPVSDVI